MVVFFATPMKSLEDAHAIRSQALSALEEAEHPPTPNGGASWSCNRWESPILRWPICVT